MQLHKATAIVQEAARNAPSQTDALHSQRAERAPGHLAQTSARYGQRGCQWPCKPAVAVQVEVTQALCIRQRGEHVQGRSLWREEAP